jgi:hypothetical protein
MYEFLRGRRLAALIHGWQASNPLSRRGLQPVEIARHGTRDCSLAQKKKRQMLRLALIPSRFNSRFLKLPQEK